MINRPSKQISAQPAAADLVCRVVTAPIDRFIAENGKGPYPDMD
jgi:hypothetical protein